jgi:hypothetical protein
LPRAELEGGDVPRGERRPASPSSSVGVHGSEDALARFDESLGFEPEVGESLDRFLEPLPNTLRPVVDGGVRGEDVLVQFDLGVNRVEERDDVGTAEQVVRSPHDLHVLPRHAYSSRPTAWRAWASLL